MKRLYLKIIIFFCLVFVIDYAIGFVGDYLVNNTKGGETKLHKFINDEMHSDVLFFGSSRCMHHYVPSIVTDSLGIDCYNCGQNGMGIPFMYARYLMISSRYKPHTIIYDVYPSYDIYEMEQFPNSRNLKCLKQYYRRDSIPEIFRAIDSTSIYKMWFNMYRYNGSFTTVIKDYFIPSTEFENGYSPLSGEISENYALTETSNAKRSPDPLKMMFWNRFIEKTRKDGVQLIFIYSPMWGQNNDEVLAPITNLAAQNGIPVINHYTDTLYNSHRELFSEPWHLNGAGARFYTQNIVREIKYIIK